MARWRLTAPHYINVPGTEWEYKEVDRSSGKQKRVVFPVPLHLDPDQPGDWNHVIGRDQGEIIVCHAGKGQPGDIEFTTKDLKTPGDPTPDMVPLDEEAKLLTAAMAPKWNRPYEQVEGNSYAEGILDDLTKQIVDLRSSAPAAPIKGMEELLAAMAGMMKQNQELLSAVMQTKAEPKAPVAQPRRA